jgi:type III pantothenate kinase
MLLAIDISNTNIKLGMYNKQKLHHHWVVSTVRQRTTDEYAMILHDLLKHAGYTLTDVDDIIISCVVPPLTRVFQELAARYCDREAVVISANILQHPPTDRGNEENLTSPPTSPDVDHSDRATPDTSGNFVLGMKLLVDNPREVGSDRLVTTLAAHALYGGPAIVIAFSTATTFDVVSRQGDFLGGAIAPGLVISAEALSNAASQLFRVEMTPPRAALGKNTIENMQSGIIYGHVGLVQGLIARLQREIPDVDDGHEVKIIAHGGLAQLMSPLIPEIQYVNQYLPLEGLRVAYERLKGRT